MRIPKSNINSVDSAPTSGTTRREFLRSAAWTAATLPAFVPSSVFGSGAPSNRLNVALIGCGSQGQRLLASMLRMNINPVAVCDVDVRQTARVKHELKLIRSRVYTDYRRLLQRERRLDAVVIATPDHWHMHLCRAAIEEEKHVYCEKPLAHAVGEARLLRDLARQSKVVTQMGNQGSASDVFRRSVEIISGGAIGQVRDVHAYIPGGKFPRGIDHPQGAPGAPLGLNWDFWVGPAPAQPYQPHLHPFEWRGWYDFGSGQLGDFGCHSFNLPMRALQLTYPERIEVSGTGFGKESYFVSGQVRMMFPARPNFAPVTLNWYDDVNPPTGIFKEVIEFYGNVPSGVLLIGENGSIFTSPHNTECILRLTSDKKFVPVLQHEGVKHISSGLPRVRSHQDEWVNACRGVGQTYSHFESGGHLTEVIQAGVLALRLGRSIDWDGVRMHVPDLPAADSLIRPTYRTRYVA